MKWGRKGMTTKTFLHKTPKWFSTYTDMLKRNRGLFVFSLVMMLAAPVHPLLKAYETRLTPVFDYQNYYYDWDSLLWGISVILPVVLSIVTPFLSFHYLYSRRAIDLYHSLPIKRSALFLGRFLAGFTITLLPAAAGLGSAWAISHALDVQDRLSESVGQILLFSACLYVFVVFVICCCGTIWEAILYGTGLTVALLGICYSVPEFAARLYGFSGSIELGDWLLAFTPFYYMAIIDGSWSWTAVFPVLMAAGLFFLSLLLYQNRKSENTGSAFSYRFLFHIISIFISVAVVIFVYIWGSELISALFLGFLAYFIISVLSNRGFKRLAPVVLRGAGIAVGMAVFILSFEATGGFGYVMRIPSLDKIESVAIRTVEAGDYQTYARYRTGSGTVISESPQYMVYRETENIALVHEIHQSLLEKKETLEEGNTSLDVDINLEYRMKNGSVFRRSYRLISEKELQNLVALNCSQEFLEQKYPFLEDGFTYGLKARTAVMEPFVKEGEVVAYESLGIAADEVAQALKKDILARPLGFETAPTADYVGRIAILSPVESGFFHTVSSAKKVKLSAADAATHWSKKQVILIYECDKNILELLEKRGKLESFRSRVAEFAAAEQVQLSLCEQPTYHNLQNRASNTGYYYDKYSSYQSLYQVTNPEDRAFLLKHLQPVYYSDLPCNAVTFGDGYCFLIPNEYQEQLLEIVGRAEKENLD